MREVGNRTQTEGINSERFPRMSCTRWGQRHWQLCSAGAVQGGGAESRPRRGGEQVGAATEAGAGKPGEQATGPGQSLASKEQG